MIKKKYRKIRKKITYNKKFAYLYMLIVYGIDIRKLRKEEK